MLAVDAVVVTHQSAAEVARCVAAARHCPALRRVIVVDNASSDGSADAARRAGADVVIESEANSGFARGVNLGLKKASADFVLLLNPDAVLTDDALDRLTQCLAADPIAVMAGPVLVSPARPGRRRRTSLLDAGQPAPLAPPVALPPLLVDTRLPQAATAPWTAAPHAGRLSVGRRAAVPEELPRGDRRPG